MATSTTPPSSPSRMRRYSSRAEAWSSGKPSKPSAWAKRTTVELEVLARRASSSAVWNEASSRWSTMYCPTSFWERENSSKRERISADRVRAAVPVDFTRACFARASRVPSGRAAQLVVEKPRRRACTQLVENASARVRQAAAVARVCRQLQPLQQRPRQLRRPALEEHADLRPIDDLGDRTGAAPHHRRAAGHRLHQHQAEGLAERGQGGDPGRPVGVAQRHRGRPRRPAPRPRRRQPAARPIRSAGRDSSSRASGPLAPYQREGGHELARPAWRRSGWRRRRRSSARRRALRRA